MEEGLNYLMAVKEQSVAVHLVAVAAAVAIAAASSAPVAAEIVVAMISETV